MADGRPLAYPIGDYRRHVGVLRMYLGKGPGKDCLPSQPSN